MKGYRLVLVSAVRHRDGMALELDLDSGEQVAVVFEDEDSRLRTVIFFSDKPVPLDVVEWFLSEAATRL